VDPLTYDSCLIGCHSGIFSPSSFEFSNENSTKRLMHRAVNVVDLDIVWPQAKFKENNSNKVGGKLRWRDKKLNEIQQRAITSIVYRLNGKVSKEISYHSMNICNPNSNPN
jgi:hypothetical protein